MDSSNLQFAVLKEEDFCSGCNEAELINTETCYTSGCKHAYCRSCAIKKNCNWINFQVLTKCSKCKFEFSTLIPKRIIKPQFPTKKFVTFFNRWTKKKNRIFFRFKCRFHKDCLETTLHPLPTIRITTDKNGVQIGHSYLKHGHPLEKCVREQIDAWTLKKLKLEKCENWKCIHKLCQPCK